MADPAAFVGYPARLAVVASPGPFLSQCFRCPAAEQRGVFSFPVNRPLLAPEFEAFVFSDRRLALGGTGLMVQIFGTVGRPVEAETIFGVARQMPVIEVTAHRIVFSNETWPLLQANLDDFLKRYADAPVVLQGQVAEVEARTSFTFVKLRTSSPSVPPDTVVSIPDSGVSVAPGEFIRLWGSLRAKDAGLPLIVATAVESLGDEPAAIPPVTSLLGRLPEWP